MALESTFPHQHYRVFEISEVNDSPVNRMGYHISDTKIYDRNCKQPFNLGLREILQETIVFTIKYGVSCKFSGKPIIEPCPLAFQLWTNCVKKAHLHPFTSIISMMIYAIFSVNSSRIISGGLLLPKGETSHNVKCYSSSPVAFNNYLP